MKNISRKIKAVLNKKMWTKKIFSLKMNWQALNKPKGLAIDCGANVGEITAMLRKGYGTVYAFEPNPYAFQVLAERFFGLDRVVCVNEAVFTKEGEMSLYLHKEGRGKEVAFSESSSLFSSKYNVDKATCCQVKVIDLIKFISDLPERVAILKMDVEGAEYDILEALIDSGVINQIDRVYVETHEKKVPELKGRHEILLKKIKDNKLTNINLNWI